ncbi:cytochrome [Pseudoalteromonas piscicida]|uniref:Cytochrome n=1 Tax=Pseudoalteromonas piscicida TaxID=43662 RepID=A0AAQ2EXW0_PSEO7|nr:MULTISPECIES: cytochrome b/b6 domain-containing protein [Pseudoalteromonas]KJY92295.1 cytochrome [Pseudoalteromonas piscicida]TMN36194.1 cytochrome [Pseudoalteromonas piscicida]TMN41654.1 cytochrome [Pseudoalteromonas piscicida]TMN46565.1 cytochrome [Pseudoalteromonas piscicida]TMN55264.1 cytochrome [Pseudoalteromonas piscicida]
MTKVWDGFIRGFHWLLVAGLVTLYITGEEGMMDLHFVTGYLLLALMAARLIWGVIGSQTAKLSALFHSPKAILSAIKSKQSHVGHNPAGSLMVLLFFVLILIQLVSGLMTTDDILVEGPLAQYVSYDLVELAGDIHHTNIELLIAAIALHIFAIVVYRLKGQNLVKTLVTGKQENAVSTPVMKSGVVAYLIFIALSALLLFTWGAEPLQGLI